MAFNLCLQDTRQSEWLQMAFSADSTLLLTISSGAEPFLEVWDVMSQRVEARVPLPHDLTTLPASFFPIQRDVIVVAGEQVRTCHGPGLHQTVHVCVSCAWCSSVTVLLLSGHMIRAYRNTLSYSVSSVLSCHAHYAEHVAAVMAIEQL